MSEQTSKPTQAATQTTRQTAQVQYVDRVDCAETFTDSINSVFFDGQTMRIEFGITRMNELKQNQPLTGRRYPACRLVLTPAAAIELINKMQQTGAALAQAGLVKPVAKDGAGARRPNPGPNPSPSANPTLPKAVGLPKPGGLAKK